MPGSPRVNWRQEASPLRAHNEGSIIFRSRSRRFFVAVTMPGGRAERQVPWHQNCPRHRPAADPKCRECHEAAKELLREMLAERDAELDIPASRLTLAAYLRSWIADMDASPATIVSYRGAVEQHIIPTLGTVMMGSLGPRAIQRWLDGMEGGPASIAKRRAVLRAALNRAVRRRILLRNPMDGTEAPKVPAFHATTLDASQAGILLEGTASDRLGPLWALLLGTGLRISEALGLTWGDVDLTGSVRVHAQLARRNGEWVRVPTKAARSVERVALPGFALSALTEHKRRMGVEFGLVFTSPRGWPLHERDVIKALYAAEDRLGLPRVGCHGLRHSNAALLQNAGVPEDVRMARLGHATVTMARYYAGGGEQPDKDAAATLNRVIGGK
jgi:integrase